MANPLDEVLPRSVMSMQDVLTHIDTIALLRLVAAQVASYPDLTELACQGFDCRFETIAA